MEHLRIVRGEHNLHIVFEREGTGIDDDWEATCTYEGRFANRTLGPLHPTLCAADFEEAFGEVSGDTIHCIISDRPIKGEDWVPISLRTLRFEAGFHPPRTVGSVCWEMGHVRYPDNMFNWHMEQTLLCWLPEVTAVHHLCVAIYEYEEVSE